MDNKGKGKIRNIVIAVIFAIGLVSFIGGKNIISEKFDQIHEKSEVKSGKIVNIKEKKLETKPVELSLLCAGDVMAHNPNIKSAYNEKNGTYDFNDNYDYVRKYIEDADLAMCNMETTFGGGSPKGYPMFNAPDELAQAVKNAGFDLAITANNHMMDTGFSGMQRTLKVLRDTGLKTTGSIYAGEKNYTIMDVKGVKVAILAYTYETSRASGRVTINGNVVSDEAVPLINSFNYSELETEDYNKIKMSMDNARSDGAEIVVVYYHWGNEYERRANNGQLVMAQRTADMGADIIFTSHVHVLQPIDILTSKDGRKVPIYYSLGNFISNQRTETLNNKYTEQGIMGKVTLKYDKTKGQIMEENVGAIPVWVDKYGNKTKYAIVPLDKNIDENPALKASGHLNRAKEALVDIKSIIDPKYIDGYKLESVREINKTEVENDGEKDDSNKKAA